jgi:hypothetical protein
MRGTWQGYYTYNNPKMRKHVGFEKTYFTIEIHSFDGITFGGNVTEDLANGGMPGTGYVIGTLNNLSLTFQKLMPMYSAIVIKNGARRKEDKQHNTLYYKGILSADGKTASGTWKFKRVIILVFGFIPVPYNPGSGTWSMQLAEDN